MRFEYEYKYEYESMMDDLIKKMFYKEGKEVIYWQIIFKKSLLNEPESKAKVIVEYEDTKKDKGNES